MKLSIEQGTFCHTKKDDRTGAVVWDDAVVMALEHFAAETTPGWFRGKKCIELGSGCGFLGIVTSCLGADTIITDQAHIVPLLEKNAQNIIARKEEYLRFGGSIECRHHNWGTPTDGATYDVIIASGVVYHEEAIDPLLASLRALSRPSETRFFLGVDYRFDVNSSGTSFPDGLPRCRNVFRAIAQRVERQRTSSVS